MLGNESLPVIKEIIHQNSIRINRTTNESTKQQTNQCLDCASLFNWETCETLKPSKAIFATSMTAREHTGVVHVNYH